MKKKLFWAVLLCLTLTFSLTACGTSDSDAVSESSQTESVSETSEESDSVSESEVEEEIEETEEISESSEEEETIETSETSSSASSSGVDISGAIDGSTTTDESAVPLGQWAAATMYATADSAYHTVYVRMTKVTAYSEDEAYIQDAIDLHNANASEWYQIDLEDYTLPDDVEWYLLDYEVYVPEDFPSSYDDGSIIEPSLDPRATNIGGGGIPSNDGASTYIGLGSYREDLEVYADETFLIGNTYAFKVIYAMVTGYQDYTFYIMSYPDGTTSSTGESYYVYFANQ